MLHVHYCTSLSILSVCNFTEKIVDAVQIFVYKLCITVLIKACTCTYFFFFCSMNKTCFLTAVRKTRTNIINLSASTHELFTQFHTESHTES